jgi:hypothetical protein
LYQIYSPGESSETPKSTNFGSAYPYLGNIFPNLDVPKCAENWLFFHIAILEGRYRMMRPNALSSGQMTPADRRSELCAILARGLIRLRMRDNAKLSGDTGEFPLHNSANQSGIAETLKRRTA